MTDELDARLRRALEAEGSRARPDDAAWLSVAERVRSGPSRSYRWPMALAAALVLVIVAVVVTIRGGGEAERTVRLVGEPASTSTVVRDRTTTTLVPAPDAVITLPPVPARTPGPPEVLVAVTEDNRLVVVEVRPVVSSASSLLVATGSPIPVRSPPTSSRTSPSLQPATGSGTPSVASQRAGLCGECR